MNVGAEDKATRRARGSPPSNDKGRLFEEQFEKMIKEAEQFADEDERSSSAWMPRTPLITSTPYALLKRDQATTRGSMRSLIRRIRRKIRMP